MHKEKLISDYQIFFELRDMYPKHCNLIAEIMRYAFDHQDTFYEKTYLSGTFYEDDLRFIFNKLNSSLTISAVTRVTLRDLPYTIVDFNIADSN